MKKITLLVAILIATTSFGAAFSFKFKKATQVDQNGCCAANKGVMTCQGARAVCYDGTVTSCKCVKLEKEGITPCKPIEE